MVLHPLLDGELVKTVPRRSGKEVREVAPTRSIVIHRKSG